MRRKRKDKKVDLRQKTDKKAVFSRKTDKKTEKRQKTAAPRPKKQKPAAGKDATIPRVQKSKKERPGETGPLFLRRAPAEWIGRIRHILQRIRRLRPPFLIQGRKIFGGGICT